MRKKINLILLIICIVITIATLLPVIKVFYDGLVPCNIKKSVEGTVIQHNIYPNGAIKLYVEDKQGVVYKFYYTEDSLISENNNQETITSLLKTNMIENKVRITFTDSRTNDEYYLLAFDIDVLEIVE